MPSSAAGHAPGDRVRVVDGPFTGLEAVIREVQPRRSRLKLAVSVKDMVVNCEMLFRQVEKAD